jgi:thiamine-phosphate pyrophosphorylase
MKAAAASRDIEAVARTIRGLYAITPEVEDTARLLELVTAALDGGAAAVQYRAKQVDAARRSEQALSLARLCGERGACFIVNDDVELARASGADGVHLGREDGTIGDARKRLGEAALIGASCYDRLDLARNAVAQGADYVAFGSVFPSFTKPKAVRAPLSLLAQAKRELPVPVVAIGGIDADNAPLLVASGVDAVAVISAVFDAPDVRAAARRIASRFPR